MRRGTVLVLYLLSACGSGSTTDLPSDECNPLGTNACMTPWPSSAFQDADGPALARPAGFQHLLAGTSPDHKHPLLEKMRAGFPAVLAALGVPEDDLLLAWDFTVATDEYTTRDAAVATQAALAALAQTPP